MAGTRRSGRAQNAPSKIYDDMLAEAGAHAQQPDTDERPLKRRRKDHAPEPAPEPGIEAEKKDGDAFARWLEDEDEDLEFEDVLPDMTVQTMQRDSDDDEEDEGENGEPEGTEGDDANFLRDFDQTGEPASDSKNLELDLSAAKAALTPSKKAAERRKPLTKEEKERRVLVHQVHLLCLLSYVHRRNHWCNDGKVQESLSHHLSDKTVGLLNPSSRLSQFGRAESLKRGLGDLDQMWKAKFEITERGSTRALWAEDPEHLRDVRIQGIAKHGGC